MTFLHPTNANTLHTHRSGIPADSIDRPSLTRALFCTTRALQLYLLRTREPQDRMYLTYTLLTTYLRVVLSCTYRPYSLSVITFTKKHLYVCIQNSKILYRTLIKTYIKVNRYWTCTKSSSLTLIEFSYSILHRYNIFYHTQKISRTP